MKFGQTAGIQCARNSLFAIAWSTVITVTIWKGLDLDNVLNNGEITPVWGTQSFHATLCLTCSKKN